MEKENTFINEGDLPSLPVPTLQASLNQLEQSLQPLLAENEKDSLKGKINQFLSSPISSILQNHLLKFQRNETCYLNHLNQDHILIDHHQLPRNPFLVLENDPSEAFLSPQSQGERAAVLTTSSLKFVSSLRLGSLSPDKSRNGENLTMKPYWSLFSTTRYPDSETIKSKTFENSKHLAILSNSQFYILDVLNDANELIFTIEEMTSIFNDIIYDSFNSGSVINSIGPITSDSFKYWKLAKDWLNEEYKDNMKKIDSALLILVLDHSSPDNSDEEEIVRSISNGTLIIDDGGIQVGTCISRWYDKLQLIVTKNSIAGVCWDSFSQDGTTVLRFTSDIYTDSVLRLAEGNYTLFPKVKIVDNDKIIKPVYDKLTWGFRSDLRTFLHLSETRLTDLICSHKIDTKTINFGRHLAKKLGVKADSFIQIALQVAHYALYGKPLTSIEPVSTRSFRNSRSEYLPIQNDELLKSCQTFVSSADPALRYQSFLKSCRHHSKLLENASKGLSFEKHLKALQNVYLQRKVFNQLSPEFYIPEELPPLLFEYDLHPIFLPHLIASNCGNPAMRVFGLTPAVSNGFGIGYIIKDDESKICLISEYRQGERLLSTLEWVVYQIYHTWKDDHKKILPHAHVLDNLHSVSMLKRTSGTSSEDEEIDLALGGYGYFDIDGLTLRSLQQSQMNTPSMSSHNSSSNLLNVSEGLSLPKLHKELGTNLRYERLKETYDLRILSSDQLGQKNGKLSDRYNDKNSSFKVEFDRASVGKKVDVKEIL
ncbi:hypothetical protein WICMUC_004141 [Wickerhamomyces mucosus]|uniref:Choline/carnitine acyltransferase domain-containing protein n=1 Tax=Wickerhamomyces mucosus TaxID=1378264 RepID=A0A9P8PJF9_9ASCO|nr:hypothetical protein WICMUC_004141 [Wickerhamomyces mucosus]